MSHQTGIRANEKLKKFFAKSCHTGKIRLFKVVIENEELTLSNQIEAKNTWEEDYDKNIKKLIQTDQPAYILCRFDKKNSNGGYDWLLLSWSPDDSHVRQKMLYASTKATLKQEFGSGQITDELHATSLDELSSAGLKKIRDAPPPLSPQEEEARLCQTAENMRIHPGIDAKASTLNALTMPITEDGKKALIAFSTLSTVNYVRMCIDIPNERIDVDKTVSITAKELEMQVPEETARYHLFKYEYTHEGEDKKAIIFIYSMPGYNCPIKERMLYSSSKAPLIETIELIISSKVDKKMEVGSGKELSEECLIEALHPPPMEQVTLGATGRKFDKPKGPQNRGAKRITKSHQCSLLE